MRWTRIRGGLKWALLGLSVAVAILCPMTRWLVGQFVYPASAPTLAVAMSGDTVLFEHRPGGFGAGLAASQLWWNDGPVYWGFWFHYSSDAIQTRVIVPLWPFARAPGLAALLLFRAERPEKRRRLGLCIPCGYDRRGLDAAAPCPECGKRP